MRIGYLLILLFTFMSCKTYNLYDVNNKTRQNITDISVIEAAKTIKNFRETSPFSLDKERLALWYKLESISDRLDNSTFKEYLDASEEKAVSMERTIPILYIYREAFDKVLYEVQNTKVKKGSAVIWLLYNMGFVVKTPSGCFGIDINHRLANDLAPYLDFMCITHADGDHYDPKLLKSMSDNGKPIISNFYKESSEYMSKVASSYRVNNFTIRTDVADHLRNPKFPTYVKPIRIDCGEDSGNFSILTGGDSGFNPMHFKNVQGPVSATIIRWGAEVENSIFGTGEGQVQTNYAILSHLIELRHELYPNGQASISKTLEHLPNVKCENTILPFWGEKLIWSNGVLH